MKIYQKSQSFNCLSSQRFINPATGPAYLTISFPGNCKLYLLYGLILNFLKEFYFVVHISSTKWPFLQFTPPELRPLKMLIKALLFLWIGTSSQDHGLDSVTDILIMKPPWSRSGAEGNVSKIEGAYQGGDLRQREPGEDQTKEELVIQDHPLGPQSHTGKSILTLDQEPPVTKRSINPSGRVEGGRGGEVRVDSQPCGACGYQQGRASRAQVHQEDQDVSQALQEVRRVRVEASKGVDEAKKVQEEDRSRQNSQGYWLVFG